MRRRKPPEQFTPDIAAGQYQKAYDDGKAWGRSHPLDAWNTPSNYYYCYTAWQRRLSGAFTEGVQAGKRQRRAELESVCAKELGCDDGTVVQ